MIACGHMYFVCKHSDGRIGPYIYEYTYFEIQMLFYMCFVLMMMMPILSICCDRMYEMFMYV
jgi:hypothetical protein